MPPSAAAAASSRRANRSKTRSLVRGDARAVVGHRQLDGAVAGPDGDLHVRAGVAGGVVEQVADDAAQLASSAATGTGARSVASIATGASARPAALAATTRSSLTAVSAPA